MLIHTIFVIVIAELTQYFEISVDCQHGYRGVADAVEHRGLDSGIMDHVLENYPLSYPQLMIESPIAHIVARKTAVAAKAIYIFTMHDLGFAHIINLTFFIIH